MRVEGREAGEGPPKTGDGDPENTLMMLFA